MSRCSFFSWSFYLVTLLNDDNIDIRLSFGGIYMADKQLGVRIPEKVMEQLERRVQEVNEMTPEASVTVSSVVRFAIQRYTEQLERADFEQTLTLPFADHLDSVERMELLAYGIIGDESELVTFSNEELADIAKGLELISGVMSKKKNVSRRVAKEWRKIALKAGELDGLRQLHPVEEEQFHAPLSTLTYKCPRCYKVYEAVYPYLPDEVTCPNCQDDLIVEGATNSKLIVKKHWAEYNELWEPGEYPEPAT